MNYMISSLLRISDYTLEKSALAYEDAANSQTRRKMERKVFSLHASAGLPSNMIHHPHRAA